VTHSCAMHQMQHVWQKRWQKKKAEDAKNEENAKKDEASKRVEPKRTKTPDADSGLEALLESGLSKVKKK